MIRYTKKEEIWNAASHGGGILLGVVFGIIFLVWCFQSDNDWARVGVILYLFGMLGSYAASTLYHSMKHHSKWKERLRKWDHAAIYWHIAGSYSPLTLTALREQGYWGWSLFKPLMDSVSEAAIIWLIAEGVSYITGAVFYSLNKKKYMHSVFHFFVLAGSVCHIIAVWDVLMQQL